ncbi:BatD family protein [Rhodohalobacter halophilus]|uniref:BatD family protein n=1 Tax=Rhodohalobacter halophilus TaxID=1812810 RepID=UPI00083F7E1A|nr:BatD family protein [Rhodohalobacter halophilus]
MIKIGSFSSLIGLGILFSVLLPADLYSQDYTLEATVSENRIFVGEQFNLNIEVSGSSMRDVSLPVLPQLYGVRVLSSTPSRSTSISIVNGRTTTSTTYSFSLIARDTGVHTIPPVSIEIDGETRQTNPIQIEIIEKGNLSTDSSRQLPDIFLEVELSDDRPVTGQQIVASVVLYFKQGIEITSFQPTAGWRTDGFWKEELENIRQPEAESVILNGVRYRTATLLRYALFPSRSGNLTLAEYPMSVGVRTRPSRNDPFGSFFGGSINQRRVSLESEPIELDIQPLPQTERDVVNINAVGDLTIERSINRNSVATGETVELTTTIRGTGNIPLLRRPEYNMPDGIDLYTPQESSNIERRGLNIRGEKTFTELLVPRAPGEFRVPEQRISVYDVDNRRQRYITLPEITFRASPASGATIAGSGSASDAVLTPVTGLAVWNSNPNRPFYSRTIYWILWILPLAILIVGYLKKQQLERLQSDSVYARSHRSFETAKNHIEAAIKAHEQENTKEIYNHLHKALSGYISDKLGLPLAGLSDHDLVEKVKQNEASVETAKTLKMLLNKCATISYAPAGSMDDQMKDIEKTEQLIKELKKLL